MDDFDILQMKDPAFRAEWKALQPWAAMAQAEIDAEKETVIAPERKYDEGPGKLPRLSF